MVRDFRMRNMRLYVSISSFGYLRSSLPYSAPGVISMATVLLVIGYPKSVVEIWSDLHVRMRGLALVRPAIVHGEQT